MSDKIHRYVIAYDVSFDPRRTRVAHTLQSYGDRIQYSVFLVETRPAAIVRLKTKIMADLDLATDSLLICDLGPLDGEGTRGLETIGATRPTTGQGPLVF